MTADPTPPFPDVGHGQRPDRAKRHEIAEHLAALPIFSGCSKRELRHLAGLSRQHQLEAGQPLFEQGQPASAAYVVVAGRVEVRRDGQPVAQLGPTPDHATRPVFGSARGRIHIGPDFDEPLADMGEYEA